MRTNRGAVLLLGTLLSACASGNGDWIRAEPVARDAAATPSATATISLTGTVHHLELEGGVYVIRAPDGTQYNPLNLPEAFRVDGTFVEIEARVREDMLSIAMVGPLIEIVRIRATPSGR